MSAALALAPRAVRAIGAKHAGKGTSGVHRVKKLMSTGLTKATGILKAAAIAGVHRVMRALGLDGVSSPRHARVRTVF